MSDLCSDGMIQAANFGESLGYAAANIFGIGGLIESNAPTPIDKLKSQITQINDKATALNQKMQISFDTNILKLDTELLNTMKTLQTNTLTQLNSHEEKLQEEISTNRVYIASCFILVLLISFYVIFFVKI
jgi:predicted PurR-regulated permease PerM